MGARNLDFMQANVSSTSADRPTPPPCGRHVHRTMKEYYMRFLSTSGLAIGLALAAGAAAGAPAAQGGGDAHFDPQGKPPSTFMLEIRDRLKTELPFSDKRDFDEATKGFIAEPPYMKIMADAGHVAQAIGKNVAHGSVSLIAPNRLISMNIEEITLDGVKMVFQDVADTEAPVELNT